MNDETTQVAPRVKRSYVRRQARQEEVRPEPVRVSAHGKTRLRKGAFNNMFGIPREILVRIAQDYGADLQWNLDTVKGADGREINDLPAAVTRVGMEQQAWESVMPGMFGGLLDGYFTKKDHIGEILMGGQVLQWRPMELTLEAKEEERQQAKSQVGAHERKMMSGAVDGVDNKIMDPRHGSAQRVTRITKTRVPSIPVS